MTAGRTLDEARRMAEEALEVHLAGMVGDREDLPAPRALEAALAGKDLRGAVPFLVSVREPEPRAVRVNVTLEPAVLEALDAGVARERSTRSAYLEAAVLERIRRTPQSARPRTRREARRS